MFIQKLYKFFFYIVIASLLLLGYNFYQNYKFDNNPLPQAMQEEIFAKKQDTRRLLMQHYGFDLDVPINISDKLPNNLYGVAVYNENKKIIIYLNKKRFKESSNYMINNVLPHEYAHAVMFSLGDFSHEKSGHSKKWQDICTNIGGLKCSQFVDHHDIIIGKTSF